MIKRMPNGLAPDGLRLCIGDDGRVTYIPYMDVDCTVEGLRAGDYQDFSLPLPDALAFMRDGVPVAIAISGGNDKNSNYETMPVPLEKV